ncbi:MAG: hypothetical protein ACYC96_05335 [Fimbriimonadaceae bacterium]
MSKRLQVLMTEEQLSDLRRLAHQNRVSVGEGVRGVLRRAVKKRACGLPKKDPSNPNGAAMRVSGRGH